MTLRPLRRLRRLLRRDRFEREVDEEMRFHLAMQSEESGSPRSRRAAAAALASFVPALRATRVDPARTLRTE